MNRDGSNFTVLHNFATNGIDGAEPATALMRASDGNLYGTTGWGGTNGAGTVFKFNKDGTGYAILYNLEQTGPFDNTWGTALVQGRDGALYGAKSYWRAQVGTFSKIVYRVNVDGSGSGVVYTFGDSPTEGLKPNSLVLGTDGLFYGTTSEGDALAGGAVFKLWPPQTPDILGITSISNVFQVTFAGVPGDPYLLMRSSDLTNWNSLKSISMPASGTLTYSDDASAAGTTFYRPAWAR